MNTTTRVSVSSGPSSGRRRVVALMVLALLALASAVVAGPQPVSAGPFNYGSVKVAVRIDSGGRPQVIQDRSAYVLPMPGGTQPSVSRDGVGRYTIVIPGITAPGGNVQIAPWATSSETSPPTCTVAGWATVSPDTEIFVACFDAATGTPREGTRFDVLYTNIISGFGSVRYTYLWSPDPSPSSPTAVDPDYYFSGRAAAAPTVETLGRGRYRVRFGESMAAWTPIVTAYGSDPRWCHPAGVEKIGPSTTTVDVVCFRQGGRPADSAFSMMMAGGSPLDGSVARTARLRVNRPGAEGLITPGRWTVSASASPNTYERLGAGRHKIVLPGARSAIDAGVVQAFSPLGVRCFIRGFVTTVTDPGLGGYRTRCIDPSGRASDARMWVIRGDISLWFS